MSDTNLLNLPLMEASQAQKHVTHNEALTRLDILVQLSLISRTLNTPPVSPSEGDRYLVAAAPTGDWAGHVGQIAYRAAGGWFFATPRPGWRAWVQAESALLLFNGTSWAALQGGGGSSQTLPLLGINTTADVTNKLSVSSSDVLFSHNGSDHRLKLNKNAAANTVSLLFQSNWSGRAEFGLAGDDDFRIKVSPDGTNWQEALAIDRTSGKVALAAGSVANPALAPMAGGTVKGRPSGSSGPPADLPVQDLLALLPIHARIISQTMALP